MAARSTTEISARIEAHVPGDYSSGRRELRISTAGLFATALIKPPRMTGSQWAEKYGRIPKGTGAESGRVTLYGYQRGLIDAMCDPRVPLISVVKAARVGYTRLATLAIGYHLHHDPTLCAVAQPVKEDAEDFGGTEIAPMLRETPVLRRMLRPVRKGQKQDKQTSFRLSNGASVRLVGAAADDAFRRYSARFQFADEIDGDGWTPGTKTQGDKLDLFWTRGETFFDRKQIRGSTPLLEETSRVAKLWAESDQRRYFVPCPHCSADADGTLAGWQFLCWGGRDEPHGIKWELDECGKLADVWYQGTCGHRIDETHKTWMDARGEWRATNPEGDHAGFHLWTGMSLTANAAWPMLVKQWLDAQKDPASRVQPFLNLRLGRTYRAAYGHELKTGRFVERREPYAAEVPAGVLYLTAGVDVQAGVNARIEVSIYGWGRGHEIWLVGHFVLDGDPALPAVWGHLDHTLQRGFAREDGRSLIVQAAAIDSGGHHTAETVQFCNERRGRRIWAIKGRSEMGGKRSRVWPSKPSDKLGRVWYMIGGNAARDWAYGSLAVEKPGPRRVHFPTEPAAGSRPIDDEFFGQLTAERPRPVKGALIWDKPKDKAREAGVCFVYAYAAVCGLEALHPGFVAAGRLPDAAVITEPTPATEGETQPVPDAIADPTIAVSAPLAPVPTPVSVAAPTTPPAVAPHVPPERQHSSFMPPRRPGGWMNRDRY